MATLESLNIFPVWITPDHPVSSARILMEGHRVRLAGVVQDGRLIGVISQDRLFAREERAPVREFMEPPALVVDFSSSTRGLAGRFVRDDLDYACVLKEGQFHGVVTATMLLAEMSRSYDPLTRLSWSDELRRWGVERLAAGDEVTILFIDLDNFGQYNKRHGHVLGDQVIRQVAFSLQEAVDPELDVVVRYGGDEFAVGTVRTRPEAEALSEQIHQALARVQVDGIDEAITATIGIYGGMRRQVRSGIHEGATLDNLINLASRDSMRRKGTSTSPASAVVTIGEP